jgi:hypothetical protein
MRMIMYVSCPPEPFNTYVRDGSAGAKLQKVMEALKPEAAYFTSQKGCRGGAIVVNLKSESDLPRVCEPWFLLFNATIKVTPAMTIEDLAGAGLDELGKLWG